MSNLRSRSAYLILVLFAGLGGGCADKNPETASADAMIETIASEFVAGYYENYPELVYEIGFPDAPMDRFGDHSASATAAWDRSVDGWLAALNAIDQNTVESAASARTYVFAREKLQAIVDKRVCQQKLWNISPTWTGWQYMIVSTLAVQPVASAAERDAALARLADIARFLDTEIANLRRGQELGYTAAQSNVDAVIKKATALLETPTAESPLFDPARRANDADFVAAYRDTLETKVIAAITAYRDFLAQDYQGHAGPGVAANPDGADCYDAAVRYHASISVPADAIHRAGLTQMSRIQSAMLEIAKTHFGTDDVKGLLAEIRSKPEYTFRDEQHQLDYIAAAVARGKAAMGDWFAKVPDAEMIIVAAPPFDQDSGGGFYSAGTADGSRPGIYTVGTYNPTQISIAGQEATAFHESYPGHHLQMATALMNDTAHPIFRYMYFSGSGEGWGLYSEKLADEMGLYSGPLDRLGMLSNEAYRAARMVVDPGMHVMGWSRDQAIQYMLDHTAEGFDSVASEIDRYAAVPGQATSYMLGSLEIERLRAHAEQELGDAFDIREFHDRLIGDGSVTLPMMAAAVEAWIAQQQ